MADEQNARTDSVRRKLEKAIALLGLLFGRDSRANQETLQKSRPEIESAVLALAAWVAAEWGTGDLEAGSIIGQVEGQLLLYLDEHRSLAGDEARAYAELTAQSELRRAEVALVQQAIQRSGIGLIERRLGYSKTGPCQRCIDLAGIHPAGYPGLFWEHPLGVCSWHPASGGQVNGFAERVAENLASFAGRGNPEALRRYWREGAHNRISWGTAGDFDRCVELVSKYIDRAEGFCQERHIEATGVPAGHAPGEQAHHAASAGIPGIVTMASWDSQEKRNKEPKTTFCGPGTSFPVKDKEDWVHAKQLLHHAKKPSPIQACLDRKAKENGWESDDDKKANNAMTTPFPVSIGIFAAPATVGFAGGTRVMDGDMVVRRGKIFGAGTHKPGNLPYAITMTPEHIALIAENTEEPINITLGHPSSKTHLDGHLGQAKIVEVTDAGDLIGETRMPKWLDDAFSEVVGDDDLPVSVELDLDNLKLKGLTLATGQAVPDAKIAAAFAASQGITPVAMRTVAFAAPPHRTPFGQRRIQKIHDQAVKGGAVCRKPGAANMASRPEANAIQQIHDVACDNGAECDTDDILGGGANKGWNFSPRPAARAVSGAGRFARGDGFMGLGKFFKRPEVQQAAAEEGIDPEDLQAKFAAGVTATTPAATVINNGRLEAVEKELANERAERIKLQASVWADEEIKGLRSMPAERDSLIFAYTEAVADDMTHPVANFANGTSAPTRLQRLVEREKARTPNFLPEDMLPDDTNGPAIAEAVANIMETRGRITPDGKPATADLAEKDPEAFRRSARYAQLMAAGGDVEHEEPSLMAAFAQVIEEAVARGNSKK